MSTRSFPSSPPSLIPNKPSTVTMLSYRERMGGISRPYLTNELSSKIAWNTNRMENMILCVGPGTPSSIIMSASSHHSSSVSSSATSTSTDSMNVDDDERNEFSSSSSSSEEEGEESAILYPQRRRHPSTSSEEEEDDDDPEIMPCSTSAAAASRLPSSHPKLTQPKFSPSMRHGGCINTASWLTCPWRLSTPAKSSHSSNNNTINIREDTHHQEERIPTQIITSGDDRLVKFWDVRHAMGNVSPLPHYPCTRLAFFEEEDTIKKKSRPKHLIPGGVIPLFTLPTGHRGNIFHAAPLSTTHKVLTCAADGYLRLSDISTSSSSVILGPDNDDPGGLFSRSASGMCFSFHFLTCNVGLLCTERGLKKFDLRMGPRQQYRGNLLDSGGGRRVCKACAVWNPFGWDESGFYDGSFYIFAGGASADVSLYDLRMDNYSTSTFANTNRIIQKYRPMYIPEGKRGGRGSSSLSSVSVSGIDLSKDLRELLVSYENDQIYTFSIFPNAPPSGPTLNDLSLTFTTDETPTSKPQPELASYGGHLNRYTFLKNAKYSGPNDEYICTGSDSGHAWVYRRDNGSVAALLNADRSTCNGVVPHPTLPFFVTYGIDSTAKLWRATLPVDDGADDSPKGRFQSYAKSNYEKSSIVRSWKSMQNKLHAMEDTIPLPSPSSSSHDNSNHLSDQEDLPSSDDFLVLPDQIPWRDDEYDDSIFGGLLSLRSHGSGSNNVRSPIGNDLARLPYVLQQNYFAAVRAKLSNAEDEPVRSGLNGLARRIAAIRLYHQASRFGLKVDEDMPWIMSKREGVRKKEEEDEEEEQENALRYGHPAELIPDFPSDWMPYDAEMCKIPKSFYTALTEDKDEDYEEIDEMDVSMKNGQNIDLNFCNGQEKITDKSKQNGVQTKASKDDLSNPLPQDHQTDAYPSQKAPNTNEFVNSKPFTKTAPMNSYSNERAWEILTETVLLLKDSGNKALQRNAVTLAAKRYDKALRYASIAFFPSCHFANITFVKEEPLSLSKWTLLLKTVVTLRLNLSTTLLKPPISDKRGAIEQAQLALDGLEPFCSGSNNKKQKAKDDNIDNDDGAKETHREARELQAKAYFRLGTAQHTCGDYANAVHSFEKSVHCTKELGNKPENVVVRKWNDAKREHLKKKKRHRKKFKAMFMSGSDAEEEGDNGAAGDGR